MVKGEKKLILIVEDDPKSLMLFRDVLQFKGYITIEATDGQQAVDQAKEHKPDLILMDIQLPVMDGIEATKIIKHDETTKGITVIALTAYAMSGDMMKMLATGFDDYISKPVHIPDFLKKVAGYLNE
jgi:CheY-like chemotaxis protein